MEEISEKLKVNYIVEGTVKIVDDNFTGFDKIQGKCMTAQQKFLD